MIVRFKVLVRTWPGFDRPAFLRALKRRDQIADVRVAYAKHGVVVHGRTDGQLLVTAAAIVQSTVWSAISRSGGDEPVNRIRRIEVWRAER